MTYDEETLRLKEELREIIDKCNYSSKSVADALRDLSSYYEHEACEYGKRACVCDIMASRKNASSEDHRLEIDGNSIAQAIHDTFGDKEEKP